MQNCFYYFLLVFCHVSLVLFFFSHKITLIVIGIQYCLTIGVLFTFMDYFA